MYQENQVDTSKSRQILVTEIDAGSLADGKLKRQDIILGASGVGSRPTPFAADARRSFAAAKTTATFEAVPGHYVLEAAMTDAHGLTSVAETVNIQVRGK